MQEKDDDTLRAQVLLAQTQTELELQKHHRKHHSHRHEGHGGDYDNGKAAAGHDGTP